jgi:ATP-dependent helicase/nuclease subunit A
MENDAELTGELARLAEVACSDLTDKLAVWRVEKLELAQRLLSDPSSRTMDNFDAVMESPGGMGSDKSWGGKGSAKRMRDDLRAALKHFEPYSLYTEELSSRDSDAAKDLTAMISLTQQAIAVYTAAKRAAGVLDFVDLLDHANRLLAEDPQLCGRLAGQIDQILVDECQDTDALQMDTLWRLAAGSVKPEATPDDGRLFLVGDAKQSIYRFRGAQVEVFQGACQALAPDGPLNLDISFRTHAPGVDFVNRVFEPLMGDYEPIKAHRTERPAAPSVEIVLAARPDGDLVDSAPAASAAQAAVTAAHIRDLVDSRRPIVWDSEAKQYRPAEYADIAILFGRMTNSIEYERQLAALDVPYYVVAGTGFFHQQEIYDVLNALRVVDNPFDDIALVGVLRSSLFGLDDNALMHMAGVCRPPYYACLPSDELASRLPAHMAESLTAAVEMIRRLHACKDAIGVDELIQRILDATGYEATLRTDSR